MINKIQYGSGLFYRLAAKWFSDTIGLMVLAVAFIICGGVLAETGRVTIRTGTCVIAKGSSSTKLPYHIYHPDSTTGTGTPGGDNVPRVLLMHGTNSCKEAFRFLGTSLARDGIEAVAFDFSGDVWLKPAGHATEAAAVWKRTIHPAVGKGRVPWAAAGHSDGGEPSFMLAETISGSKACVLIGTLFPTPLLAAGKGTPSRHELAVLGAVGGFDEIFYPHEVAATLTEAGTHYPTELFVSPLSNHFIESLDPLILSRTARFLKGTFEQSDERESSLERRVRNIITDILGEFMLYLGIMAVFVLLLRRPGTKPAWKRRSLLVGAIMLSLVSGLLAGHLWKGIFLYSLLPFAIVPVEKKRDDRPSLASVLVVVWLAFTANLIAASSWFWNTFPVSLQCAPLFPLWTLAVLPSKIISMFGLFGPPPWEEGWRSLPWILLFWAGIEMSVPGAIARYLNNFKIWFLTRLRGPFSFTHTTAIYPTAITEATSAVKAASGFHPGNIVLLVVISLLAGGLWFYRYQQGVVGSELFISQVRMVSHSILGPVLALAAIRISARKRDRRMMKKGTREPGAPEC